MRTSFVWWLASWGLFSLSRYKRLGCLFVWVSHFPSGPGRQVTRPVKSGLSLFPTICTRFASLFSLVAFSAPRRRRPASAPPPCWSKATVAAGGCGGEERRLGLGAWWRGKGRTPTPIRLGYGRSTRWKTCRRPRTRTRAGRSRPVGWRKKIEGCEIHERAERSTHPPNCARQVRTQMKGGLMHTPISSAAPQVPRG